jgi:hypothetical protein
VYYNWTHWLVESYDGPDIGFSNFLVKLLDMDIVPLHWHKLKRRRVWSLVRRPVIEPSYFRPGSGEGMDLILLILIWPAKPTLGLQWSSRSSILMALTRTSERGVLS